MAMDFVDFLVLDCDEFKREKGNKMVISIFQTLFLLSSNFSFSKLTNQYIDGPNSYIFFLK